MCWYQIPSRLPTNLNSHLTYFSSYFCLDGPLKSSIVTAILKFRSLRLTSSPFIDQSLSFKKVYIVAWLRVISYENLTDAYISTMMFIIIVTTPPKRLYISSLPLRWNFGKLWPKLSSPLNNSPVIHAGDFF